VTSFKRDCDLETAAAASLARFMPILDGESDGDREGALDTYDGACDRFVLLLDTVERASSPSIVFARERPEAWDLPAREGVLGGTYTSPPLEKLAD
jgi:hypothetical protein